ncbi:hypothetical protein CMUS01_00480 [Colletotrichum musicola]|uniref:Uncharacterized protein n=1 Tax=Colletotrichum musicola TaxID=2175873 RepID=A0A8H6U9J5_9PEZI|nr:hypothetical protein CMUS01_00480 [Colletotrichum musicola]
MEIGTTTAVRDRQGPGGQQYGPAMAAAVQYSQGAYYVPRYSIVLPGSQGVLLEPADEQMTGCRLIGPMGVTPQD